ncbi:PP-loop family-domain-containing protein [Scheffersomyces amazonensis]|uniref:PP-loop family-domain-containing protein n=1 Tax=Scheffersomyces amazonensis TaxID=1078765 RepID=UPI00315D31C9
MISHEVFKDTLLKCWKGNIPKRVVVALSGGVDSVCLTYLLSEYRNKYNPQLDINAITIDHKYRINSDHEAVKVGELVRKWGVNHIIKGLSYEQNIHNLSSFEEVARMKRYKVFEDICLELNSDLLVAHNLNDQIETFVQRLQGNSSLFGLCGLKLRSVLPVQQQIPYKHQILVLRPLLSFDKQQLIETCQNSNIKWFEDITNKDITLTRRNYLRHLINDIIPNNDKYNSISKQNLIETHQQVVDLSNCLLKKVKYIHEYMIDNDCIKVDEKNAKLRLIFPKSLLTTDSILPFSRYLYFTLFPFSSVKHYHWVYAKLERQLVPRFVNYLQTNNKSRGKFIYLNLVFEMTSYADRILLEVVRQPIQRTDLSQIETSVSITNEWSSWVMFDRRFWLRFKSNSSSNHPTSLTIVPYNHKLHRKLLHPNIAQSDIFSPSINTIPAIINNDNMIVGLPTHDLYIDNSISGEWTLKPNVYSKDLMD